MPVLPAPIDARRLRAAATFGIPQVLTLLLLLLLPLLLVFPALMLLRGLRSSSASGASKCCLAGVPGMGRIPQPQCLPFPISTRVGLFWASHSRPSQHALC